MPTDIHTCAAHTARSRRDETSLTLATNSDTKHTNQNDFSGKRPHESLLFRFFVFISFTYASVTVFNTLSL